MHRAGDRLRRGIVIGAAQPEVNQLHVSPIMRNDDVGRLQIVMNQLPLMQIADSTDGLHEDTLDVGISSLTFPDEFSERHAVYVFLYNAITEWGHLRKIEHRDNIWVLKRITRLVFLGKHFLGEYTADIFFPHTLQYHPLALMSGFP